MTPAILMLQSDPHFHWRIDHQRHDSMAGEREGHRIELRHEAEKMGEAKSRRAVVPDIFK